MKKEKTRKQLIEAAKLLFIRKGFDNTTMSDIATESGLCRRTLYSYYESKIDVYQAVVSNEMSKVLERLKLVAALDMPIQQKIMELIYAHFKVLKEVIDNNGTLKSSFFRNIWYLEHFRKDFDEQEKLILQSVIMEGKSMGVFHVGNVKRAADVINYCMRGFEVPYISGRLWRGNTKEEIKQDTQKMFFGALGCVDKF